MNACAATIMSVVQKTVTGCHRLLLSCAEFAFSNSIFTPLFSQVALKKEQMYISRVNRKVFKHATLGTKYENLNMVASQSTVLVVCAQPKVSKYM